MDARRLLFLDQEDAPNLLIGCASLKRGITRIILLPTHVRSINIPAISHYPSNVKQALLPTVRPSHEKYQATLFGTNTRHSCMLFSTTQPPWPYSRTRHEERCV
ncbi:hypothetical protein IG631_22480 [Alternaria alternata]|nr:hypothetical protein IG631_22480 [Alternaria alternata]